ncbi:hypothetical protein [Bowmanella pacifica]|uniref:Uncharacterized protein n=1 Tax=Bowmanella pacifica TaxID=502051 RepID=A0A918DN35_9ALTE|nr:hypothetical protein [Bowmanella pacifica]GGO73293.1 hypothetical protein GCM10010982_33490 [Bowmanella pacifica]
MKASILIFGILAFAAVESRAEQYACEVALHMAEERSFTARINVHSETVTISGLTLSQDWPLPAKCDSPLGLERLELKRNKSVKEISFGPYSGKECTYFFILNNEGSDIALLFPVRTGNFYGERPYVAKCNAI